MTRDIEEIREILEADCNSDKKCEMISNIINGKPHYFKEPKKDILDKIGAEIEEHAYLVRSVAQYCVEHNESMKFEHKGRHYMLSVQEVK